MFIRTAFMLMAVVAATIAIAPIAAASTPRAVGHTTARATPQLAVRALACSGLYSTRGCPTKPSESCKLPSCPMTARLRTRVNRVGRGGPGRGCDCQPIIRAQFAPVAARLAQTNKAGSEAETNVVYNMGSFYSVSHETFVSVKSARGWLVTNVFCTGRPSSTIYNSPLKPCYKPVKS